MHELAPGKVVSVQIAIDDSACLGQVEKKSATWYQVDLVDRIFRLFELFDTPPG